MLVGCGHNVLTNYEVKGVDASIPIFGYPFGFRLGYVKANQNLIRGNSAYTIHSSTGTDISTGSVNETQVIQFSSSTQINEGNVEKIMQSDKVSDEVKRSFIKDFLNSDNKPTVLPVSTNTPMTVTASGDNPKLHKRQFDEKKPFFSLASMKNFLKEIVDFALLTVGGQILSILVCIFAIYIAIRLAYAVLMKILAKLSSHR
jgi:hypothetical protein